VEFLSRCFWQPPDNLNHLGTWASVCPGKGRNLHRIQWERSENGSSGRKEAAGGGKRQAEIKMMERDNKKCARITSCRHAHTRTHTHRTNGTDVRCIISPHNPTLIPGTTSSLTPNSWFFPASNFVSLMDRVLITGLMSLLGDSPLSHKMPALEV
jgi:hypothetical protein